VVIPDDGTTKEDASTSTDASSPVDAGKDVTVVPDASDAATCKGGDVTDANTCEYYVHLCEAPKGYDGGFLTQEQCKAICTREESYGCRGVPEKNGELTVACFTCVVGRRPHGLERARGCVSADPVLAYFEETARLEAASVDAFRLLAADLRAHRAPKRLVVAAERAAADEIRHARSMGKLAGKKPSAPVLPARRPRSLEAIARENAVEGCVRETFGALTAVWQSQNAKDPAVRRAMKVVARDETRHAALAWEIAAWAEKKLARAPRARIQRARRQAADALLRELAAPIDAALVERAGLPDADEARRLAVAMTSELWA
jgi:hypothetical protein